MNTSDPLLRRHAERQADRARMATHFLASWVPKRPTSPNIKHETQAAIIASVQLADALLEELNK